MPEFMLALRAACLKLRKERENSPRYTLPSILDIKKWRYVFSLVKTTPLFSLFSLSWGRQEDNFGQIHQLRQQQQQQHAAYAWPHSQRAFSLIWMTGLDPFSRVYLVWRIAPSAFPLLTICYEILQLFKRAAWMNFFGHSSSELSPQWISHVISSKNYSGSLIQTNFIKIQPLAYFTDESSWPVLLNDRKHGKILDIHTY